MNSEAHQSCCVCSPRAVRFLSGTTYLTPSPHCLLPSPPPPLWAVVRDRESLSVLLVRCFGVSVPHVSDVLRFSPCFCRAHIARRDDSEVRPCREWPRSLSSHGRVLFRRTHAPQPLRPAARRRTPRWLPRPGVLCSVSRQASPSARPPPLPGASQRLAHWSAGPCDCRGGRGSSAHWRGPRAGAGRASGQGAGAHARVFQGARASALECGGGDGLSGTRGSGEGGTRPAACWRGLA